MLKSNWGSILKKRRDLLGMTQDDIAQIMSKTRNHIHNMEAQKRPPKAEDLGIYADVIGLDISELYESNVSRLATSRILRSARLEKNIELGDLARKSGIDFFKLGKAELGEIMLEDHELQKIAESLGISEERLFGISKASVAQLIALAKRLGLQDDQLKLLREFMEDYLTNKKDPV
ncbi:MAG: helix-turn-helix domain-containing protein [Halanaerobiales bacterium]|nr:helix-turn-helix domain-containing protein [Halanaerobiales bacterium]